MPDLSILIGAHINKTDYCLRGNPSSLAYNNGDEKVNTEQHASSYINITIIMGDNNNCEHHHLLSVYILIRSCTLRGLLKLSTNSAMHLPFGTMRFTQTLQKCHWKVEAATAANADP